MESRSMLSNEICANCYRSLISEDESGVAIEKCRQWLSNSTLSDDQISSSQVSDLPTDSDTERDNEEYNIIEAASNVIIDKKFLIGNNANLICNHILNKKVSFYKNIKICESQNVHVGDTVHIHGSVYIKESAPTLDQNITINANPTTQVFPVVSRRTWLAQPPVDLEDVQLMCQPAKFVIICHSASDESDTQTGNNLLVRLIQQFHIESLNWNDIGYNFLVGADGSIYEGRGWNVMGSHTLGYNTCSIGICFVGCYMRKLPPLPAIKRVQAFIKYGVEIGAIKEDYSLIGHCQCRSSESPGAKLFQEIKIWDRWDQSVSVDNVAIS